MKAVISLISVMSLMLISCSNSDKPLVDVDFSDYSLSGSLCEWLPVNEEAPYHEVIVIESDDELRQYISCSEGEVYPGVDFTKSTLLLARGAELYVHTPGKVSCQQTIGRSYRMTVNLLPTLAPAISYWEVAILVEKSISKHNVNLIITRKSE